MTMPLALAGPAKKLAEAVSAVRTTVAGTGPLDIRIAVVPAGINPFLWSNAKYQTELVELVGAEVDTSFAHSIGRWHIQVIDTATDFEHSPSKYALLDICLVTRAEQDGVRSTYYGVLNSAQLYPAGTDLHAQSDGDTIAGWCDECDEPHPFMAYLPPKRPEVDALIGSIVVLTTTPNAEYDDTTS